MSLEKDKEVNRDSIYLKHHQPCDSLFLLKVLKYRTLYCYAWDEQQFPAILAYVGEVEHNIAFQHCSLLYLLFFFFFFLYGIYWSYAGFIGHDRQPAIKTRLDAYEVQFKLTWGIFPRFWVHVNLQFADFGWSIAVLRAVPFLALVDQSRHKGLYGCRLGAWVWPEALQPVLPGLINECTVHFTKSGVQHAHFCAWSSQYARYKSDIL